MNWFDYILLAIIGLSALISLFRGLIREVFSLLVWVAAFWLAYRFADSGAALLTPWIDLPSARHLVAFVALFLAVLIVGGVVNYVLAQLISKTGLSGSDRFFGLFFGIVRGMVAVVALAFFVQATPLVKDPWWRESRLGPHFGRMAEWLRDRMPDDLSGYFSLAKQQTVTQDLGEKKAVRPLETEAPDSAMPADAAPAPPERAVEQAAEN